MGCNKINLTEWTGRGLVCILSCPEMVVLTDEDLMYVRVNKAFACRMDGTNLEEITCSLQCSE